MDSPSYEFLLKENKRLGAEVRKLESEITEHKSIRRYVSSESELKESEERFRSLFENAPLDYQSLDADGNIIEVNRAWCDTFGYEKSEVLGRNFGDFLHPDNIELFRDRFPRFKRLGKVIGVEFKILKKDGDVINASFNGRIATNSDGSFRQTHCIFQDITQRRIFEEAISESEEKFRNMIQQSIDGIILYDENGYVAEWNRGMEKITGYGSKEIIGIHISDLMKKFVPDDDKKTERIERIESLGSFSADGIHKWSNLEIQFEIQSKSGEIKFVEGIFYSISLTNGFIYGSSMRDVTLKRFAEDKLALYTDELKKALEAKDLLFGIIAHDLRSPFSGFMALLDNIVSDFEKMTIKELQETTLLMNESAHNLYRLLENLLGWASNQIGILEFHPENVDLSMTLKNMNQLFKPLIEKNKISFEYDIIGDAVIFVDLEMLNTILRNLISNSLKFVDEYGRIRIKADTTGEANIIMVADDGCGINPDILHNIFDIRKATNVRKFSGKGVGLGLALCKDFAAKHGGTLRVESELGAGATFILELPKRLE